MALQSVARAVTYAHAYGRMNRVESYCTSRRPGRACQIIAAISRESQKVARLGERRTFIERDAVPLVSRINAYVHVRGQPSECLGMRVDSPFLHFSTSFNARASDFLAFNFFFRSILFFLFLSIFFINFIFDIRPLCNHASQHFVRPTFVHARLTVTVFEKVSNIFCSFVLRRKKLLRFVQFVL